MESEVKNTVEDMREQLYYIPISRLVRQEARSNEITSFNTFEQTFNHPQRTALYDQVLRRLAHADFNLQLIHQSGALKQV